jgi:hypothetical protein
MQPFKFRGNAVGGSQAPLELTNAIDGKDGLDQNFNTFWSVVDPFVVQDSIPRELRTNATKQGSGNLKGVTKSSFDLFNTFEDAAMFAQKQNRPLVIMEIKAVSKVRPQLPLVEKINEPKA